MRLAWYLGLLRPRLRARGKRDLGARLVGSLASLPGYRLTLRRLRRPPLDALPAEPWPGNADTGRALMGDATDGRLSFRGRTVAGAGALWAGAAGAGPQWLAAVHRFDWLADLRAAGGEPARIQARALIDSWIEHHRRVHGPAFAPEVLAARLGNWLGQQAYLAAGAPAEFTTRFAASVAEQARQLSRVAGGAPAGPGRFEVLKALIQAGLALEVGPRVLARRLDALAAEIATQVLPDGGHVSRSPAELLAVLRRLIDIRAALTSRGHVVPDTLQDAIARMAPMLRFFRHGDGGLALFNHANQGTGWLIDMVLAHSNVRGRPPAGAKQTGFERLAAGRALVLVDTGGPPPPGYDAHAHAGTLSFEMSIGRERLVVNCGAHAGTEGGSDRWTQASRATAAHSTLVVADLNSSEILRLGIGRGPRQVACQRVDSDGETWIDARHDGYAISLGLIHHRKLYLSIDGQSLRGEDVLTPAHGRRTRTRPFAVRFHLHPGVRASMVEENTAVLLRLPSGAGWRLHAAGGEVELADSVYLGVAGEIKRCEQIVIRATAENGEAAVKWSLTRIAPRGAAV